MTKAKSPETLKADATPTAKSNSSKREQILALLARPEGAMLEEMSALAAWQPHSTRAYLSGLRKAGHPIQSSKSDGIRRYRLAVVTPEQPQ